MRAKQTIATRKTWCFVFNLVINQIWAQLKKGAKNIFLQMASMTFKALKYWLGDLLWHSLICDFNRTIGEDDKNWQYTLEIFLLEANYS